MSEKTERAAQLHKKGWNCAQCTACVFAEELGMKEEEVFVLMEGFGLGMGGMQGTCGAVSAMAAVVGMKQSDRNLEKPRSKKGVYKDVKALVRRFEEKNGSTICREIKGVDTKVVLRSCPGCIEDGVAFLEEYLAQAEEPQAPSETK